MEDFKRIVVAAAMLSSCTISCAEVDSIIKTFVNPVSIRDRSPGEKMKVDASKVWSLENCDSRMLPFFRLDLDDVSPASVRPGEKLNHRLEYSMCPEVPNGTIRGRLTTSIYYEARKIHTDQVDNFEIKPGQWIVDADVLVPENAKPGVYSLQVDFSSRWTNFKDSTNFVVLP